MTTSRAVRLSALLPMVVAFAAHMARQLPLSEARR
jgi:hypothetical protein